ncbi:hypothetical protein KM043_018376 [Ampulex compressa]|nr:hypothetical protein KM043_018376 [Ampulex compressa]
MEETIEDAALPQGKDRRYDDGTCERRSGFRNAPRNYEIPTELRTPANVGILCSSSMGRSPPGSRVLARVSSSRFADRKWRQPIFSMRLSSVPWSRGYRSRYRIGMSTCRAGDAVAKGDALAR